MLQGSKEFLKNNNIRPRISFKGGEAHTLMILKDKPDSLKDQSGKDIFGVKYLVRENGEEKSFFTSSIGLIQKLSEFSEGDEVVIQMKSRKGEAGGFVSYFDVKRMGEIQNPSLSDENTPAEDINDELAF